MNKIILALLTVSLLLSPVAFAQTMVPRGGTGGTGGDGSDYDATADADRVLIVNSAGVVQSLAADICADASIVTSVPIDTATSGNVQLVAIDGSEKVTACGYTFTVAGAVEVQFVYGTGAACATGETNLTGPMKFTADGDGLVEPKGAKVFAGAASNAVCIELSAAVQTSGVFTYVQQ